MGGIGDGCFWVGGGWVVVGVEGGRGKRIFCEEEGKKIQNTVGRTVQNSDKRCCMHDLTRSSKFE